MTQKRNHYRKNTHPIYDKFGGMDWLRRAELTIMGYDPDLLDEVPDEILDNLGKIRIPAMGDAKVESEPEINKLIASAAIKALNEYRNRQRENRLTHEKPTEE